VLKAVIGPVIPVPWQLDIVLEFGPDRLHFVQAIHPTKLTRHLTLGIVHLNFGGATSC
jgi:hypothetical protein